MARPAEGLVPLVLAVALFMEQLDSTVIATSLPAIAADIGASPVALKLAVTARQPALAGAIDAPARQARADCRPTVLPDPLRPPRARAPADEPARRMRRFAGSGTQPQKRSALAWRICGRSPIWASASGATASSTPSSAIASPLFCSRPSAKVAMLMPSAPSLVPSAPM